MIIPTLIIKGVCQCLVALRMFCFHSLKFSLTMSISQCFASHHWNNRMNILLN